MRALTRSIADLLWVAGPKVASGGLQLLTNLLLVQQLGPTSAGVVFVCVTAILLTDAILGSAVDVAVVRLATGHDNCKPPRLLEVQKAALIAKGIGCAVLSVPVVIWSGPLSVLLFHGDGDRTLLVLSAVSAFGLLVLRSVQTCFQIAGRFKLYGMVDLVHSAVRFGGIGVFLAVGVMTPPSLLALFAVVPLLVAGVLLITGARSVVTAPFSRSALQDVLRLVKWYAGAAAISSINTRIDIFFVSAFANPAEAGLYSAAQVFIQPFQLLGMYLAVILAPRIMPLWESGQLSPIYFRFQRWTGAATILVFAAAFFSIDTITARLLPSSYDGAANIILLLVPSSLMALLNFPWTVSFLMFNHARFLFVMEVCAFPVLLLFYRWLVDSHGAAGAAMVTSGYALVKTAVYQIVAGYSIRRHATGRRYDRMSVVPQGVPGAVV